MENEYMKGRITGKDDANYMIITMPVEISETTYYSEEAA